MRVCLVSIHPRLISGQINSLVGLARAMRERGHDVRLVTAFAQDQLFDEDRMHLPEAGPGVLAAKLTRMPQILWRLRRAAEEADVVHLNLPTPGFSVLGDIVQSMIGRPIVVGFETHLPTFGEVLRPRSMSALRFYLPLLAANNPAVARLSGFHAARYVVASQLQAGELARLGVASDRTSVIPNVVDTRHVAGDFADDETRWPSGGPVISYVGHFNHVKGVDVLIRSMPTILQKYPTAELVLAWSGLGPIEPIERAIHRANLGDRVRILGRLPLGGIFRRSRVLALPYRLTTGQGTYPSLLLEAMSAGVPLVTSDLPLLRELMRDGETAELARPEDAEDLGRRIIGLLDDPVYCQDMMRSQRVLSQRSFEPNFLASRFEAMYEDVIGATSRHRQQAGVLSEPAGSRSV